MRNPADLEGDGTFLLDSVDRGIRKLGRDVVCMRWDALVVR